ncbi:hypothetical protein AMAG_20487 [Allomyces macrogynus ATCC 38327]|uniref:Uncharacterized protein n=1 Tax=Allomyces macrogynus (strain ATCC 38327) TaxID=578462 RepID=A0A0L0TD12_ALLM3|nr:hypothetical protein AMAG_20487 [Allomyces macrogynus ATCC 38327]|eukprot:KNE72627.1 hypothetical protein AMAG_20487 [Allomyces macrogynus ATCC 38327]
MRNASSILRFVAGSWALNFRFMTLVFLVGLVAFALVCCGRNRFPLPVLLTCLRPCSFSSPQVWLHPAFLFRHLVRVADTGPFPRSPPFSLAPLYCVISDIRCPYSGSLF